MQAGLCDTWALVQAFDWHRQAAEARILAAFRQPDAAMVEAVAKAISGAPFPSAQSIRKATAALAAAAGAMEGKTNDR